MHIKIWTVSFESSDGLRSINKYSVIVKLNCSLPLYCNHSLNHVHLFLSILSLIYAHMQDFKPTDARPDRFICVSWIRRHRFSSTPKKLAW